MLSSEEPDGLLSTAEISTLNFVSSCISQFKRKLFFGNGILLTDPKKYLLFINAWDLSGFRKPTIPHKWMFHRTDCNLQTHQYFKYADNNKSKIDYIHFSALLNREHWRYFILFLNESDSLLWTWVTMMPSGTTHLHRATCSWTKWSLLTIKCYSSSSLIPPYQGITFSFGCCWYIWLLQSTMDWILSP